MIDTSVNLFAFIGQKISVDEFDPNFTKEPPTVRIDSATGDTITIRKAYIMDGGFAARYKVLKWVYNKLDADTISFCAYDHYGRPAFSNSSVVMLYISKDTANRYVHKKYQFDEIRRTATGEWRGKNGQSLEQLFLHRKKTVFEPWGIFL